MLERTNEKRFEVLTISSAFRGNKKNSPDSIEQVSWEDEMGYLMALVAGGGIYMMLPQGPDREQVSWRGAGGALLGIACAWLVANLGGVVSDFPLALCFWTLAAVSLLSAVMMITSRNPIYSALWFASVLVANSGLYLIGEAQFLSAATLIVYAGAIIVTFLFVIMLAQPRGTAVYDRNSREPFLATIAGVILGGTLTGAIHQVVMLPESEASTTAGLTATGLVESALNASSPTVKFPGPEDESGEVVHLGKTLMLDHAVSFELIGMLLLVAVVGAILIATNSPQEKGRL